MNIDNNLQEELTITQKYVNFILDNIIKDKVTVQLYKPFEDGSRMYVKMGPTVQCKVNIKIIAKYTRSAKLKLKFDKYEVEEIFFIPFSSSPESIESKTRQKIEKIVNNTFIEDNRTDDIKKMYEERHQYFFKGIEGALKSIKTMITKNSMTQDQAKNELLTLYENQIMDLIMMSKIELGDDVIAEIKRLKEIINRD